MESSIHFRKGNKKVKHKRRLQILFDIGCKDIIVNKKLIQVMGTHIVLLHLLAILYPPRADGMLLAHWS